MDYKIGVFGSGISPKDDYALVKKARAIGQAIVDNNGILITGGCSGLPYEAARRAFAIGGTVIGISPAMDLKEHTEKYKFPTDSFTALIYTGMEKKGRNIISVRSCDAAIFICGRFGTLNEFTIAHDEAKENFVIGILSGSGGFADRLIGLMEESAKFGKTTKAIVVEDTEPNQLVSKIFASLCIG